jgi:hypothetical protein
MSFALEVTVAYHACRGSGRKKEKDQLQNLAKFRVEKATHHTPFLYEAMATIHMTTSTSLGAYFSSPHLAAYPTHPFNGNHSHGCIKFPRCIYFMSLGPAVYPMHSKIIGKQPPQWSSIKSVIHM